MWFPSFNFKLSTLKHWLTLTLIKTPFKLLTGQKNSSLGPSTSVQTHKHSLAHQYLGTFLLLINWLKISLVKWSSLRLLSSRPSQRSIESSASITPFSCCLPHATASTPLCPLTFNHVYLYYPTTSQHQVTSAHDYIQPTKDLEVSLPSLAPELASSQYHRPFILLPLQQCPLHS